MFLLYNNFCDSFKYKLTYFSPELDFIKKTVFGLKCKWNDWFLYETQPWAGMMKKYDVKKWSNFTRII